MVTVVNPRDGGGGVNPVAHISSFFRTSLTRFSYLLNLKPPSPPRLSFKIETPLLLHSPLSLPSSSETFQSDSLSSNPSETRSRPSPKPGPEFPSGTRISTVRGAKRTPDWLKEMFAATQSIKNDTGSRFFVNWGDAVSYLEEHYIPNGVVRNCDLDSVYEHLKEKPHLVQFVSNENQVKAANKLLKPVARGGYGKMKLDGIPVFTSQNLDLVIKTTNGIKRYTPYFFDKILLDNILETSVDSYFQSLIVRRYNQRLGDDHSQSDEEVEETEQNTWDLPEVQEALHEVSEDMSLSDIPLNLLSKLAQNEVLYAVDKVLLGNRWLRKAIGIQPKFPYVVDSFKRKSAASFLKANKSPVKSSQSEFDNTHEKQAQVSDFQFPFGDWLTHPWLNKQEKQQSLLDTRRREEEVKQSHFLPKVTIVDISTENPDLRNGSSSGMTRRGLLEGLEQEDQLGPTCTESKVDERDPLFVADIDELTAWYSDPKGF
ncbi:hypothetical protein CASFOL_002094 [Castilleja foliolosa]|uniref:Uncharacterized protein n=1 Tax=Castilleja foliolosa TaxID=1961234 RepID=A0ABD3EDL8_9LAMI